MLILSVLSALFSAVGAASIGPTTDLRIVNSQIFPDGFLRDSVVAEGTFPGPIIKGNKGDTFLINVINELLDPTMEMSTSIHWHGLFQHGTNDMDGVAFVTQCPIPPSHSFQYNFSSGGQAGTFWYHSHIATQYCDGLRGPLVIYDPEDPHAHLYDVDDDSTVLTLADWYQIPSPSAGIIPPFDSTLINGLGRFVNGPPSPLAVVSVQQGKRYRFRLINISCDPDYVFSVDKHTMTVIEVDGVNVKPYDVDSIRIYASQRYSLVLNANQTVDNYWIRAFPNHGPQTFAGALNSAILRYAGAKIADPVDRSAPSTSPLLETELHPLEAKPAPGHPEPGGADIQIELVVSVIENQTKFIVNGASYAAPGVPVLLQVLSGTAHASELAPAGSVYPLPANKTVEINIPGGAIGGGHPVHLHGHNFAVVRSANSTALNYATPVWRDTVNIGASVLDNATIRFRTDNPGPWFLHCHIDWHLQAGFAVIMAEDLPRVPSVSSPRQAWRYLCGAYHRFVAKTKTAAGHGG
ncbi:laccase T2 copper depleted [Dentipellis sp. KUC8613]|nr:laccase T2 copper depleted [Dentipellis sp. KUC8613]